MEIRLNIKKGKRKESKSNELFLRVSSFKPYTDILTFKYFPTSAIKKKKK